MVEMLGAGYLIYLGLRLLLTRRKTDISTTTTPHSMRRLFVDGVFVSVLNPKIAVFFMAFLPQFVQPDRSPVTQQVLSLGLLYVVLALVTDSVYAFLAGGLRHWIAARVLRGHAPQYASGVVYLGLGVGMALTGRRH